MKKVFLLFISLFLGLGIVTAKEEYNVSWINDELSNGSVVGTIRHMLKVDDGLLVGGYDDFKVMVMKLDNDGKEVKKLVLDYEGVVNGIYEYNGKYFFIATNDDEWWNVYVYEIDSNLNIVRSKATNFYEEGSLEITELVGDKVWITTIGLGGYSGFGVLDENDNNFDSYYIDLDDFSTGVGENDDFSHFSKSNQALIYGFKTGYGMPTISYVGHGFTMLAGNQDLNGWGKGFVEVVKTDNLNMIFDIDYDGDYPDDFSIFRELYSPAWYSRIVETDDRVVAGGENYAFLDLYDFDGNFDRQIDIVDYLYGVSNKEMSSQLLDMISSNGKLYVAYQYCDIDENNCSVNCKLGIVEIKTRYNIETKVTDGKGTVKAINVASSGDEVTFEVTPEKGYVLDVVKVTDRDGNVLTFTDYTFTMPSADVLIEASFKKAPISPNTVDSILIIAIVLMISGGSLYILKRNKFNILNK